ncbi:MAG TPA: helix-turn-helix domain-containing protein, partial [Microbacteriaceae bacterium]
MTSSSRITAEEMRAWKALRLMSRQLEAHLARELARTSRLSMQDYDVLSSVAPLPERRWPAKALMHHLQWSYSRLSHHLDRMEARGLVTRERSRQGPGIDVVIT